MTDTRTVVTLRARWLQSEPTVGELMSTGSVVYRIVQVVRLRQGGSHHGADRFRLVCVRLAAVELLDEPTVHAWRWDRTKPPARPAVAITPEAPAAPRPFVARAKPSKRRRPVAVEWSGVDFGPGLRRRAIRDRAGIVLREPDVELVEGADLDQPNRRVRRAVRTDPLNALLRSGSITGREVEAAETLRGHLEKLTPTMVGGTEPIGHASWFSGHAMSAVQIEAATFVRRTQRSLGASWWPVLWICYGGTVTGLASVRCIREATAREVIREGLAALADFVEGRTNRAANVAA